MLAVPKQRPPGVAEGGAGQVPQGRGTRGTRPGQRAKGQAGGGARTLPQETASHWTLQERGGDGLGSALRPQGANHRVRPWGPGASRGPQARTRQPAGPPSPERRFPWGPLPPGRLMAWIPPRSVSSPAPLAAGRAWPQCELLIGVAPAPGASPCGTGTCGPSGRRRPAACCCSRLRPGLPRPC